MLTKEKILTTIGQLPDNITIEEVIEELILLDKIEQGIKDGDEGRVFTSDEVKDRLKRWLE